MTLEKNTSRNANDNKLTCDLLIVGGGIIGLWIARLAMKTGLKVILIEKNKLGSGASGGLLGALMPHIPEQWDDEKQFQFEALDQLADEVSSIEQETGLSCGYLRCGRLLPLARPQHREMLDARYAYARNKWETARTGYEWNLLTEVPHSDWPSAHAMPHGLIFESFAARINPRSYLRALSKSISDNVRVIEGDGLSHVDITTGVVQTINGLSIGAGHTVLAAGHESFRMLGQLFDRPSEELGRPIKGQAALLEVDVAADLPLVYQDGTYAVPHEGGRVAIGSTSENDYRDGFDTDTKLDTLISKASALCPQLEGALVLERWAGLRPKTKRRDPMIGFVPDHSSLLVATGGFKITFAIAHKMAGCVMDLIESGRCEALPKGFNLEAHL